MTYFSGFSLQGEAGIFSEFLGDVEENPYVVAGFSYGAQKALAHVCDTRRRVDRLLLLSPAWFLDRSKAFVRTQRIHYKNDPKRYLDTFLRNVAHPSAYDLSPFLAPSTADDLQKLLTFSWPRAYFERAAEKGVKIEVYLGGKDRIVDAEAAHEFFKTYATSYLIKPFGHLLR